MRKISMILFVLCTVAYSCSNDENDLLINETIANSPSNLRTIEDAIDIAKKAKALAVPVQTRSTTNKVEIDDVVCIKSTQTRSSVGSDTLMYIVNFANDNGFAVISANPNTEDLLALVESGHFKESNHANDGFEMFMDYAKQYVETTAETRAITAREEQKLECDTIISRRQPKLSVNWGQTGCEGSLAPNGFAGCGNVAMAQVMSYFQYPSTLILTYDGNLSSIPLNWSQMILADTKHPHTSGTSCNQQIAKLLRQLGNLTESDYTNPSFTNTYLYKVHTAYNQTFLYNVSNICRYTGTDFSTPLSNNKLIHMHGETINSDNSISGHDWIVDGNLVLNITTTEWSKLFTETEWHILSESTESRKYIHINWGWHGNNNGYFSTNVLSTNQAYSYDTPYNYNHYLFNTNLYYFEVKH